MKKNTTNSVAKQFDDVSSQYAKYCDDRAAAQVRANTCLASLQDVFAPVIKKMHEFGDTIIDDCAVVRFVNYDFPYHYSSEFNPVIVELARDDIKPIKTLNAFRRGIEFIAVGTYEDQDVDGIYDKYPIILPKAWFYTDDWAVKYKEVFDQLMSDVNRVAALNTENKERKEREEFMRLKAKFEPLSRQLL